jgi:hypothetical protein
VSFDLLPVLIDIHQGFLQNIICKLHIKTDASSCPNKHGLALSQPVRKLDLAGLTHAKPR